MRMLNENATFYSLNEWEREIEEWNWRNELEMFVLNIYDFS